MASAAQSPQSGTPLQAPSVGAALPVPNRGLVMLGVMLATIMQILDTTIANVALPHMQTALDATADSVTWVLTSYIVASAMAIPITGWLSDRVGSRNLFLVSIVGFVVASVMCGAANSLTEMVLFRMFQGICAAFMNPLSQTVMLDINPPEKQNRAMAIWGMGIMVGPIMGPVIGGFLTENYSWRWVFYVNVPLGIVCFALLWWLLPSRPIRRRGFDLFGFALLALGLTALQLMLDRGQGEDWLASIEIWAEMIIAVIAFWMFAVHMWTAKNPMFDRDLWKDRNLVTAIAFLMIMGLVMMATMALLPPMLQTIYGHTVLDTGMLLMPRGIGVVFSTAITAQLISRGLDPRWTVGGGFMVAAYSLWDMTHWSLDMGTGPIIVAGLIQGIGLGMAFMPLNGLAFATLAPRFRTEGASLLNLARNVGASAGISLVTTLLARSTQTSHAALAADIRPERMDMLDPNLLQMLGNSGDAVLAMLNAEINRQALMIGYLNDFWAMSIVTLISVPLVLFMRLPKGKIAAEPGAGGH